MPELFARSVRRGLTGRFVVLACALAMWAAASGLVGATFSAVTYGAVGDGATDDTTAIQDAINAASAAGGGVVLIPAAAGSYLSNPLTLASDIDLSIAAGATLQMEPYGTYDGGSANPTYFINGNNLKNLTVEGGGTIDGQGLAWWNAFIANGAVVRPPAVLRISNSQDITVTAITIQNAPMINQSYYADTNMLVNAVTVFNPYDSSSDNISPNTDGMDVACTNMLIENCNISTGDDVIALGAANAVTQNITITGCTFGTGHGLSIGSHTGDGVTGLWVNHCTFTGTQYGLRFKSDRGNGGLTKGAYYSDLTMTGIVYYPIYLDSYYGANPAPTGPTDDPGGPVALGTGTPQWQNISFTNVNATTAAGAKGPMQLWGLPEASATDFLFDNVSLTGPGSAEIYHAASVSFTCTCRINGVAPSASNVTTSDATVAYLACPSTPTVTPSSTKTPLEAASPIPTGTPSASASPTRTATPSASASRTPSATFSRTSTATLSGTPSATPRATDSPTPTPSPSASRSATGTATPTLSVTATQSPTPSRTASPSGTATRTETPSASASRSPTSESSESPTQSATPATSASGTASPTPASSASATESQTPESSPTGTESPTTLNSPSDTESPTPTNSASVTLSTTPADSPNETPSQTPSSSFTNSSSPTSSPSWTVTVSATNTDTPGASLTQTHTAVSLASFTPSPAPATQATSSPTPTGTPNLVAPTLEATASSAAGGPLKILEAVAVPNPDPDSLALDLAGPADGVEGTLFSVAQVEIRSLSWGPQSAGWNRLSLPEDSFGLPQGLYYLRLSARRGNADSVAVVVKLMVLRP